MTRAFISVLPFILLLSFCSTNNPSQLYVSSLSSVSSLNLKQSCPENQIQALVDNGNLKSIAFSIFKEDEIIWQGSYGDQQNIDLVYMIGSVTKTFTAMGILQLYEKNIISLDDNVNDYLPFDVVNPYYPTTNITFKMLMTHTSSLPKDNQGEVFMYVANVWDESLTNLQYPTWLKEYYRTEGVYYQNDSWINRTPGKKVDKFEYSNAGYTLLGYLLELITNSTYQEYLINNILNPLNMNSTNTSYEAFSSSILADTYDPITGDHIEPFNVNERGAGSLRSNVNDLTIYLQAHMSKTKLIESNVLNETTINLMHKDYGRYYSGAVGYGHGWLNYEGLTGHTGAMRNFATRMLWDGFEGIGVVLLNNYVLNINQILVDEELFSLLLEIGKDPSLLSTINCATNTQSTLNTISDRQISVDTECNPNNDYLPYLISVIVPLLVVSAVLLRRRLK